MSDEVNNNMGDASRFFEHLLYAPVTFNNNTNMQANAGPAYASTHDLHQHAPAQFVNLSPPYAAFDPSLYAPTGAGTAASSISSNPAAMLQLLTALNADHRHYQPLLNLSASSSAAEIDYQQQQLTGGGCPATLNFFQPSSVATNHSTSLHNLQLHAAAAPAPEVADPNHSLQLAQYGPGPYSGVHSNTPEFLNLFINGGGLQQHQVELSRPMGTMFSASTTAHIGSMPLAASSCLQLQPLESQYPLQQQLGSSASSLFQKRAAQRRQHGSAAHQIELGANFNNTGTSSSTSSKARHEHFTSPVPVGHCTRSSSTHLNATKSPSSFSSKQQLSGSSSASAAALSDQPMEADQLQQTGLSESADKGHLAKLHAHNDHKRQSHLLGLRPAASGHGFTLTAELEEGNCAEALFHMHDPELQRMEAVPGGSSLVHDHTADDDELLLMQSDHGGEESNLHLGSASVSEHHTNIDQDSATIPIRGNGRGKVKGPPAKNLMAERRRRKKLNDRLYTLRSVVPKISKMDRASILGDAIDYLKELLQRINDLHNELEASSAPATGPMLSSGFPPPTPTSFTNQAGASSSLTPTSHASMNLAASSASQQLVKLEDCAPASATASTAQLQLQSMCGAAGPAGLDPSQPPKIEVRVREGRALNIHMFCGRRPGLLLATMRALDGLGVDVQQAVISCFNGFALDVFRAEQSPEEEVAAEEIKRVLLHTATPTSTGTTGGPIY
ncbi:hypothetical protein L7F22_066900 [Adiantum nelumboides]|nr:hypothetical protein [Adiantum nelumboides]